MSDLYADAICGAAVILDKLFAESLQRTHGAIALGDEDRAYYEVYGTLCRVAKASHAVNIAHEECVFSPRDLVG